MPELRPFRAVHYDPRRVDLDVVVAPPYDVIGPERRAALAASHPYQAVHLDLPQDEDGADRYTVARRRLAAWLADGVLVHDPEPSLTVYRMEYTDDAGRARHTHGVIGAVRLHRPDEGEILPHEGTTPRDATDRLRMLRACRANLSPIWLLSPVAGLTAATAAAAPADASWADADGTVHRIWRRTDPAVAADVQHLVAQAPLLIADGHHRYETALAYRDERRAVDGPGPWDHTLAYVVELAPEELDVRPIHRLLTGVPAAPEALAVLGDRFEVGELPADVADADLPALMASDGVLLYVTADRRATLRPRPGRFPDVRDLDTSRLDAVLEALGSPTVAYQHGADHALAAVRSGAADAAVLVRPVGIDRIEAIAHGGERMPAKTTFFSPKPSTGAVFRLLDD